MIIDGKLRWDIILRALTYRSGREMTETHRLNYGTHYHAIPIFGYIIVSDELNLTTSVLLPNVQCPRSRLGTLRACEC